MHVSWFEMSYCIYADLLFVMSYSLTLFDATYLHFIYSRQNIMGWVFTWLSSPRVINMKKNSIDHNGGPGKFVTASGYTTNAKPAPWNRYIEDLTLVLMFS